MMREAIQLAAAFFGALGFALVFNLKGFSMFWSSFGCMLSWGVYLTAAIYFKEEGIRYFFAALFLGLYAEIFARLKKKACDSIFGCRLYTSDSRIFTLYNDVLCIKKSKGGLYILWYTSALNCRSTCKRHHSVLDIISTLKRIYKAML